MRNPNWVKEELVLALDLYLRSGLPDNSDPAIVELSSVLRSLEIHSEGRHADSFRNPNGVGLKLANFAAIHRGRGMTHYSNLDVEVWERYAWDKDALAAAVAAVREGLDLSTVQPVELAHAEVTEVTVEAQHVEQFQVSTRDRVIKATRSEQTLVRAFKRHLESQGHKVTRHRYRRGGPPLYCDLVDKTDHVLYEAKSDVLRTSVRMAIGQLLDYRRFEDPPPRVAVLLPSKPPQDLIDLIHSVDASVVWRTEDGFDGEEPPATGNRRPGSGESSRWHRAQSGLASSSHNDP